MAKPPRVTDFPDRAGGDLGALFRSALVESVPDASVERLVARMRRARARRARFRGVAGLGLAAALLVAALAPSLRAPRAGGSVASAPEIRVFRGADGAVVLEFPRPEAVHAVAKSLSPQPGADLWTRLPAGPRLVDRNGPPVPGTVVFYRVE
ncbi:MAG: hypothetical protein D6718_11695 [Acidobacteria bacterium]|nr:MAG: hypothetical protein D6718_11695 [Acidobacteriota bacterium]